MNNKILSGYVANYCLITGLVLLLTGCGGKGVQNIAVKTQNIVGEDVISSQVTAVTQSNSPVNAVAVATDRGTTPSSIKYRPLNDTGNVWGGEYPEGNNKTCIGETITAQDCSHGRDVTHNDDSDGHAGFSYTKLSSTGAELPASATEWACVKDNVTGLVWEGKTTDGGLRDYRHHYTWYNSTGINDAGWPGVPNGSQDIPGINTGSGTCFDNDNCDTEKYTAQVNAATLCGASDWRLPTRLELLSLVNNNRKNMARDMTYFPEPSHYYYVWTSTPAAEDPHNAWFVDLAYGYSDIYGRESYFSVRLVRDTQ